MLFPGMLNLTSNLRSDDWDLQIARPNKCPKLWVTGRPGTRLSNCSSALKVVLQLLMNLSLCTSEENMISQ